MNGLGIKAMAQRTQNLASSYNIDLKELWQLWRCHNLWRKHRRERTLLPRKQLYYLGKHFIFFPQIPST
jgi:hypothetical protein